MQPSSGNLILGRANPWSDLYDPSRMELTAAAEWAKENVNTLAQYREYVTGGDVDSIDKIRPGEGAVIRRGALKVACYRDDSGRLHEHSAVCPHLGGIVRWNSLEKSWDCPVHGSRFDADGCVLNGPANTGLRQTSETEEKAA
jgi:Rieske Fe-S protein